MFEQLNSCAQTRKRSVLQLHSAVTCMLNVNTGSRESSRTLSADGMPSLLQRSKLYARSCLSVPAFGFRRTARIAAGFTTMLVVVPRYDYCSVFRTTGGRIGRNIRPKNAKLVRHQWFKAWSFPFTQRLLPIIGVQCWKCCCCWLFPPGRRFRQTREDTTGRVGNIFDGTCIYDKVQESNGVKASLRAAIEAAGRGSPWSRGKPSVRPRVPRRPSIPCPKMHRLGQPSQTWRTLAALGVLLLCTLVC